MEIKKKRIAKSMGASTRLAKPTGLDTYLLAFFSQTIFFCPCYFHQKLLLSPKDVSFVHMRGWSHNSDLGWSQLTVQPSRDFPSSIFHPIVARSLIFGELVREMNCFSIFTLKKSFSVYQTIGKILTMGEK